MRWGLEEEGLGNQLGVWGWGHVGAWRGSRGHVEGVLGKRYHGAPMEMSRRQEVRRVSYLYKRKNELNEKEERACKVCFAVLIRTERHSDNANGYYTFNGELVFGWKLQWWR